MSKSGGLNATIVDTAVTSSETTVAHELGRVPQEAFVLRRTDNVDVYRGTTAWDSTNIYVIGSGAVNVRLLII